MVIQSRHRRPRLTVIVAREEPGDIDARVVTPRRTSDGPDLVERAIAALWVCGPPLDLSPGLQVGTRVQTGTVDLTGRRQQVTPARRPGRGGHAPALKERSLNGPVPPIGIRRTEKPAPFLSR